MTHDKKLERNVFKHCRSESWYTFKRVRHRATNVAVKPADSAVCLRSARAFRGRTFVVSSPPPRRTYDARRRRRHNSVVWSGVMPVSVSGPSQPPPPPLPPSRTSPVERRSSSDATTLLRRATSHVVASAATSPRSSSATLPVERDVAGRMGDVSSWRSTSSKRGSVAVRRPCAPGAHHRSQPPTTNSCTAADTHQHTRSRSSAHGQTFFFFFKY